jgi:hypothetical protein
MPARRKGTRRSRPTARKVSESGFQQRGALGSLSAKAEFDAASPEREFESEDAVESRATRTHADSAPEAIRAEADRFYRAVGQDVDRRMAKHDGEFRTGSRSREWGLESVEGIALYGSRFPTAWSG